MKTTISLVALFASVAFPRPQPGLPFLLIWPTARSTALAAAMTGLADDPDAAFFNPAGLAFQTGWGATADYAAWLPALYPHMHIGHGVMRFGSAGPASDHHRWALALDVSLLDFGPAYCVGELLPPYPDVWDGAVGLTASRAFSRKLSVGAKAKLVRSYMVPDWVWKSMPGLGIEAGGTGTTWAADVGALWKPSTRFSLGGSVANLGPGITYTSSGERDPSPTILRLGACWTPVSNRQVRVNILPEWDKVLAGMLYDSTGRVPLGDKLQREQRETWKALGVEVTAFELLTARIGYFEDMAWDRGGIVFERKNEVHRHNIYDILTRRGLGTFKSIGLCWGFGVGYKDYFRIDVSSDAAIYDFDTSNWKLSLVANDIAGGIRELGQVRLPWEG